MPSTIKRLARAVYLTGQHDADNVTFCIDVPQGAGDTEQDLTRKLLQGIAVHEYRVSPGRYTVTVKRMAH